MAVVENLMKYSMSICDKYLKNDSTDKQKYTKIYDGNDETQVIFLMIGGVYPVYTS